MNLSKYILTISVLFCGTFSLLAGNTQQPDVLASHENAKSEYVPSVENLANRKEFEQSRFGIFIHWGIYSMLGHGEWVMHNENIDYLEYQNLAAGFFPSRFDATAWAELFKASGAKYVTFTSRHHDGFSMFKSEASPYNIVDASPFGRDVVGELSEALSRAGLNLHLYYSHLDWGRTDFYPRGRTGNGTGRPDGDSDSWRNYCDFMNSQLTELLTNYGRIGAIWFDGVWDMDARPREEQPEIWNLSEQYELIHRLQPGCLIGNNHHLLPFKGEDIQIFERDIPGANEYGLSGQEISHLPLETCQTMNRSWGYRIKDTDYKSVDFLIEYLVRTAAKGANLLLNVGPRPDGSIPQEAESRLRAMGEWLSVYGESIYGSLAGEYSADWGVSTSKADAIYLHVFDKNVESIEIQMDKKRVSNVLNLKDGSQLQYVLSKGRLDVRIPKSAEVDRVIKIICY